MKNRELFCSRLYQKVRLKLVSSKILDIKGFVLESKGRAIHHRAWEVCRFCVSHLVDAFETTSSFFKQDTDVFQGHVCSSSIDNYIVYTTHTHNGIDSRRTLIPSE